MDNEIDSCNTCKFWDSKTVGNNYQGVCNIISYPDKFKQSLAVTQTEGSALLITDESFLCKLHKNYRRKRID